MRFLVLFCLCFVCVTAACQYQPGYLSDFFFGRQPGARAEAMGKAYVSLDGDLGSIYYNPAGTASLQQSQLAISYTPPGYYATKGYYFSWGVNYRVHKYIQLALSQFKFDYGKTNVINATKTPYSQRIVLNASSEPARNLLLGLNANYFTWQPGLDKAYNKLFFDIGLIKKFDLTPASERSQHTMSVGGSIQNVNYASTTATLNTITSKYDPPVITRFGLSYMIKTGKAIFFDSATILKVIVQGGYQKLLNSKYRSGIQTGAEVTLLDVILLRAGWYNEKVYDFNFPDYNKDKLAAFTYGFGIHIPSKAFFKKPFDLRLDYTSLPQVNYSKVLPSYGNFKTFGLSVIYRPANKR